MHMQQNGISEMNQINYASDEGSDIDDTIELQNNNQIIINADTPQSDTMQHSRK